MRYNYNRMEALNNIIIVAGLTGTALLWIFCAVGILHALWNTAGEHMLNGVQWIRRWLKR